MSGDAVARPTTSPTAWVCTCELHKHEHDWEPVQDRVGARTPAARSTTFGRRASLPYAVRGKDRKGDQILEFDQEAEKIILTPPMAGG